MDGIAKGLGPQISRQVLKLRDRTLLEGAMATAALVAMADDELAIEETLAVKVVLENLELLKVYDPRLALSIYTNHLNMIREDAAAGREAAMKLIGRCSEEIEAAELVVKVGIAVAKADKEFRQAEIDAIGEICAAVGILGFDPLALVSTPTAQPN